MKLNEARAWSVARQADGHESDGCTYSRDWNFSECCVMHDLLRRLAPIPPAEADKLLRLCIADKGHPVMAWVYWFGVSLARWLRFYQ